MSPSRKKCPAFFPAHCTAPSCAVTSGDAIPARPVHALFADSYAASKSAICTLSCTLDSIASTPVLVTLSLPTP